MSVLLGVFVALFVIARTVAIARAEFNALDFAEERAKRVIDESNDKDWMRFFRMQERESNSILQFLSVHRWTAKQLHPKLYSME